MEKKVLQNKKNNQTKDAPVEEVIFKDTSKLKSDGTKPNVVPFIVEKKKRNPIVQKLVDNAEDDIDDVVRDGSRKRNKINLGLLAQEVMSIEIADGYAQDRDSQLITHENEDGKSYGLKYDHIVPVLINAVKEQQTIINDLKSRIETLENT